VEVTQPVSLSALKPPAKTFKRPSIRVISSGERKVGREKIGRGDEEVKTETVTQTGTWTHGLLTEITPGLRT